MTTRFLSALLIILAPSLGISQSDALKGKIIWDHERPLNWDDFKGPPDQQSAFYALTSAGVYYELQQTSQTQFHVFVETLFDPGESWCKKDLVTDALLVHEQHHFDIHEIYSRLFVKSILELRSSPAKKVFSSIKEAYLKAMNDSESFSDQYDKETSHSKNADQQMKWNDKIDQLLAETQEYDIKEITLEVK